MSVDLLQRKKVRKVPLRGMKRTAQKILSLLKQERTELSVALVGDREIEKLNRKYRHKSKPTDVLSFPAGDTLAGRHRLLGDVVISVDRAEEQAKSGGWTLNEEIDRLLIHGILHLLGYDHEGSKKEARVMRALERKISLALCRKNSPAL